MAFLLENIEKFIIKIEKKRLIVFDGK